MKKFLVIIEETNSGFSAYAPDLPGCIATGATKGQTEKNMYDALQFHIEGMQEEGLDIPIGKSEAELMVFAA
jgi:predicted RNase H-like HicB family nuclease